MQMSNWIDDLKKLIPDYYERHARLYPMLFLLFPILLTFWGIVPDKMYDWESVLGLALWCGSAFLLKELGRDRGKLKEKDLWARWGGAPTTSYLRHRGDTNKTTLARVHKNIRLIITDIELPTAESEQKYPDRADEVYEECTRVLKDKTRDTKKYPLIFKELCSYGFWRNLWGLKPWGICISISCFAIIASAIYLKWRENHEWTSYNLFICAFIDFAIALFWLTLNENRIKISALAYAERLFEATERLTEGANDSQRF